MEPLLQRIVAVIDQPAASPLLSGRWGGVYEQLFGAAFGLSQSRATIDKRVEGMREYANLVPRLAALLRASCGSPEKSAPELEIWSTGFFLNKAQQNVVAVVDRSLNLLAERFLPEMQPEEDLNWLLLQSRARFLAALPSLSYLHTDLARLGEASAEYERLRNQAGGQTEFWNDLASGCRDDSDIRSVCKRLEPPMLPRGVAFFATVHQVNWFKHHPAGAAEGRRPATSPKPGLAGRVSLVHWAAALGAFEFAGAFAKRAAEVAA